MVNISDLLDMGELSSMMSEKRINKQVHPTLPISIYNYSNRAQFMNKWTKAERVCRGLIVEDSTGKVIARGPEKFFNYGQTGAPEFEKGDRVLVTRKEDGSLGIGWAYSSQYGVATRGSFTSDQAVHATALLTSSDKRLITLYAGKDQTQIWEIVFPDNRIVLSYGDRDENIPLGKVDNLNGLIYSRKTNGIQVGSLSVAKALSLPIPDNEEGYVLDIIRKGSVVGHVKLKGEKYKILHGLLTNTNSRRIWVQLAAHACHHLIEKDEQWANALGHDPADFLRVNIKENLLDSLLTDVPDEFYDWVTKQIDSIQDNVSDLLSQANTLAAQVKSIEGNFERYQLVKDHQMSSDILAFAKSGDSDRLLLKAWKLSKPAGNETPFKTIED